MQRDRYRRQRSRPRARVAVAVKTVDPLPLAWLIYPLLLWMGLIILAS
ncbi:hypothetical protein ACQZV8_07750 [Magnetococcales bacterium HHB-1]